MAQEQARIVFMGTPDFAATILERVYQWPAGKVVGVYSQPDRPAGRGKKIVPTPVKAVALGHDTPVYQPLTFRDKAAVDELAALKPDFLLVAAYGLILPQAVLDIPTYPPLNVHGSLLPAYRGAAPIQRAIMEHFEEGAETGVSIMRMEASLDSGPVFATVRTPIGRHTGGSMHDALARMGADALCVVMDDLLAGTASSVVQDHAKATHAAKLTKEDGRILWNRPIRAVDAHVRGVSPWPGPQAIFSFFGRQEPIVTKLSPGRFGTPCGDGVTAGSLALSDTRELQVACADCWYVLETVIPQGRKPMPSADFVRGLRLEATDGIIGTVQQPQ